MRSKNKSSVINAADFKPKITHKKYQQQVADLAKLNGWAVQFWWRSFHSAPGFLDLVLAHPLKKRVIFAEIKIPPDTLSKHQQEWFDVWGQIPFVERYVWKPDDWDAIVEILSR